jgi:TetR/AcrR family transcriptional regulator
MERMYEQTDSRVGSRRRRSDRTRLAILTAAERNFAEAGLAGARTERIAAAAGVNKAMLYYYFRSKEDLYQAVLEDHFRAFNRQALELLSSPGPASTILLRYVRLHFDFISSHHQYACLFQQLMMAGGKPFERLVQTYFHPRARALNRLLERGIRKGEFRNVDRFHAAVSLNALIVFYFSAAPVLRLFGHADAYSSANLKCRKREVLDFIRHALFRPRPRHHEA